MSKILLIEDNKDLNELLSLRLRSEGYELKSVFDFVGVEALLDEEDFDCIIADRNLPSMDALCGVKELRKKGYNEPVIFLTAKALQDDILQGFENGGDEYITKPFNTEELLLRIKALLKRTQKQSEKLRFGNFMLDLENKECFENGVKLELSRLEFELLACFFENKNTLLSRQFLSENVWQKDDVNDKSINIALTRLRAKIPSLKEHITSIRGIGYKLC